MKILLSLAMHKGKAKIQEQVFYTAAAYDVFITQTAFITVSLIVSPT